MGKTLMISDLRKKIIFDAETDGLLKEVTKIHCLCLTILEDGNVTHKSYSDDPKGDENGSIIDGLKELESADLLIGHNIIGYDVPVCKKLYPWFSPKAFCYDTLIASKLAFREVAKSDYARIRSKRHGIQSNPFPMKLIGRYSLEAWGFRFRVYKGAYGKTTDWKTYDADMLKYCKQDVVVTHKLYNVCLDEEMPDEAIQLEMQVAEIIAEQERNGWLFNFKAAQELYIEISGRADESLEKLQEIFPPFEEVKWFTPKRDNKTRGYVKGVPFPKKKLIPFNPNSGLHIVRVLKDRYGWEPEDFTDKSLEQVKRGIKKEPTPKTDEEALGKLAYAEIPALLEYQMLKKRLGQLAEGQKAWLKLYDPETSKIFGRVDSVGTRTRRMTHNNPNVAQVPNSGSDYGTECRALFMAPEGYKQVGIDAAGLELRCLAHYMFPYDKGAYVDTVLNGNKANKTDSHSMNAKALIVSRDIAKTWFYGFIYGAGDEKLGRVGSPLGLSKKQAIAIGKKRRADFLASLPALDILIEKVKEITKLRGYLKVLDGLKVPSPSLYASLNSLLQTAGAIIMKRALVIADKKLRSSGLDYYFVGNIHDEFQLHIKDEDVEAAKKLLLESIPEAGEFYNFRCPLEGEVKIGSNWAETH